MRSLLGLAIWAAGSAIACAQPLALAAPAPQHPDYAVEQPRDNGAKAPMGWGMFALDKGRSLDLTYHQLDWADDPEASRNDTAVGLGWRGSSAQALIGYEHRSYGPKQDPRRPALTDPVQWRGSSVLGLSLSIRR